MKQHNREYREVREVNEEATQKAGFYGYSVAKEFYEQLGISNATECAEQIKVKVQKAVKEAEHRNAGRISLFIKRMIYDQAELKYTEAELEYTKAEQKQDGFNPSKIDQEIAKLDTEQDAILSDLFKYLEVNKNSLSSQYPRIDQGELEDTIITKFYSLLESYTNGAIPCLSKGYIKKSLKHAAIDIWRKRQKVILEPTEAGAVMNASSPFVDTLDEKDQRCKVEFGLDELDKAYSSKGPVARGVLQQVKENWNNPGQKTSQKEMAQNLSVSENAVSKHVKDIEVTLQTNMDVFEGLLTFFNKPNDIASQVFRYWKENLDKKPAQKTSPEEMAQKLGVTQPDIDKYIDQITKLIEKNLKECKPKVILRSELSGKDAGTVLKFIEGKMGFVKELELKIENLANQFGIPIDTNPALGLVISSSGSDEHKLLSILQEWDRKLIEMYRTLTFLEERGKIVKDKNKCLLSPIAMPQIYNSRSLELITVLEQLLNATEQLTKRLSQMKRQTN